MPACACCQRKQLKAIHTGRTHDGPLAKDLTTLVCPVCDAPGTAKPPRRLTEMGKPIPIEREEDDA